MKTLAVIDVQNGFIKPEYADLPRAIRAHIDSEQYDHVLFGTFVNHSESNFVQLLHQENMFESPEIDIAPELADLATPETTFERSTYSLFKSDAFREYLKRHGIKRIEVCGLVADSCVLGTSFEGFDLGYEIKVLNHLMQTKEHLEDPTADIFKRNIDPEG